MKFISLQTGAQKGKARVTRSMWHPQQRFQGALWKYGNEEQPDHVCYVGYNNKYMSYK